MTPATFARLLVAVNGAVLGSQRCRARQERSAALHDLRDTSARCRAKLAFARGHQAKPPRATSERHLSDTKATRRVATPGPHCWASHRQRGDNAKIVAWHARPARHRPKREVSAMRIIWRWTARMDCMAHARAGHVRLQATSPWCLAVVSGRGVSKEDIPRKAPPRPLQATKDHRALCLQRTFECKKAGERKVALAVWERKRRWRRAYTDAVECRSRSWALAAVRWVD
jgi:hypothetical protein